MDAKKETDQQKAIEHVASWGRQTIAFAMSLRAQAIGKPIDDPGRAGSAGKQVHAIAQELWEAAHADCKQPVQHNEIAMKFAKRVLDWAAEHRA